MSGIHRPSWFSDETVVVSTAPTCGLSRGGRPLFGVDRTTGRRLKETDPETGEQVDAIDDQLALDMRALASGRETDTLRFLDSAKLNPRVSVPAYYDRRFDSAFDRAMAEDRFRDFRAASLGELKNSKLITVRGGHGSPSAGERVGTVPYIKVSDLRAGLVNINPTNRVPRKVADRFWRGPASGLRAFDLLCPERTSKNIGDFCVLMPGQEQLVLTKEIIILRPGPGAPFDPFYLLWAMTLRVVRDQWRRVIFMQTNREDVGKRYLEVRIPVPTTREAGEQVSVAFRDYYRELAKARTGLSNYLAGSGEHHFFVSGAEPLEEVVEDLDDELEEIGGSVEAEETAD